jgi:quercetin dioxygenase-like cupin family protein
VLALLALGALGTGVAHAIISVAAGRYGATRASATTYLIPAVALFLGVVVRHEKVPLLSVAGSAVCIGGAWMLRRAQSPHQVHNMSTLPTTPQFLRDGKFLPLSRGGISRRRMTNANTKWIIVVATVCGGLATTHLASSQDSGPVSRKKDRARVVSSQPLPKLDGDHLKGILVEVRYGPGEASSPHAHPCAVMGYIVEGSLRTQIEGEPERIYQAGESFYEAPNGVHRVSANASSTEKAVLVGYLICDHDTPLSVDVPASISAKGRSK